MAHCCNRMNVPFHECLGRQEKRNYLVRKTKQTREVYDEVGGWTEIPDWFTRNMKKLKKNKILITLGTKWKENK